MKKIAGVIIKKDNKYLLVQEKKEEVYGLWNWPAGHVQGGDTVEDTAVREAREETGYLIKIINEIEDINENDKDISLYLFKAEIIQGKLKFPKDEILDVKWFTREEIVKMKNKLRNPWVLKGIKK